MTTTTSTSTSSRVTQKSILARIAGQRAIIEANDQKDGGWSRSVDQDARREIGRLFELGLDVAVAELRELHRDLSSPSVAFESRRKDTLARLEGMMAQIGVVP